MNSNHRNIETRIRTQLERYYDGSLSPEDTIALLRLMESLEPLPSDLESDLELLRLLGDAEAETALIAVPDDLEDKLRSDLRRRSRGARRRMRLRMAGWGAAASLLLALSVTYVARIDSTVDLSGGAAIARNADSDTTTSLIRRTGPQLAATSPAVTIPAIVDETPAPAAAPALSATARGEKRTATSAPRRIKTAAEYTTRTSDGELSAADRETLREAFGSFRQATEDVSRGIRRDINSTTTEITASMAEMNTELNYISSTAGGDNSNNTSEILLQP